MQLRKVCDFTNLDHTFMLNNIYAITEMMQQYTTVHQCVHIRSIF